MQKLGIDKIAKITGVDDIDIGLPGKEKCLYFIAADDQNDNLTYLVALFWTLAYRTLVQIAKKSKNGYLIHKIPFIHVKITYGWDPL